MSPKCDYAGIISCRELHPNDPKHWCDDCIQNAVVEAEYKCEGDR